MLKQAQRSALAVCLSFWETRGGQLPSLSLKITLGMCHLLPPGAEWQGLRGPGVAAAATAVLVTFPHRAPELFSTSP